MKSMIKGSVFAFCLMFSSAFAADVDGEWNLMLSAAEGAASVSMTITVDGEKATAMAGSDEFSGTYKDGELKLKGNLYLADAGMAAPMDMTAKLDGEQLKGKMSWDMYLADLVGNRK